MGATTQPNITIKPNEWTKLLAVSGFAYSERTVFYAYGDTAPASDIEGMAIRRNPVVNTSGNTLWGFSPSKVTVTVSKA